MSLILDTDHCIAILRGSLDASQRVSASAKLFVTAVTVAELVFGAYKSEHPTTIWKKSTCCCKP